jgi:hypothetical protein
MQDPTIARLAEKNCQQAQIIEQANDAAREGVASWH